MIKEAKNIDFYTTGREPSNQDFKRISEWIQLKKEKQIESKHSTIKKQNLVKIST